MLRSHTEHGFAYPTLVVGFDDRVRGPKPTCKHAKHALALLWNNLLDL